VQFFRKSLDMARAPCHQGAMHDDVSANGLFVQSVLATLAIGDMSANGLFVQSPARQGEPHAYCLGRVAIVMVMLKTGGVGPCTARSRSRRDCKQFLFFIKCLT
jgi:hypothetical protein